MTWQDIAELHEEGFDIESHTMNHKHLNKLSIEELDFEIGQSKQCLVDHGINPTIFAYPYGEGWNKATVIRTVAKYYDLARTDTIFPLTFLHCNGSGNGVAMVDMGKEGSSTNHNGCRNLFNTDDDDDATLAFANNRNV